MDRTIYTPKESDLLTPSEVFLPVFIEGESTRYLVSSYGRIYNTWNDKFLTFANHKQGYKLVRLTVKDKPKSFYVHRIVLLTFDPLTSTDVTKMTVNHIDTIKSNNWLTNLEWVSSSHNTKAWHVYLANRKKMFAENKAIREQMLKEQQETYEKNNEVH